ncbi:hypothetical protein POL68_39845 [Stigmatella sp. ncwal1]|uniref:DUF1080 domain-containing protein n=1 Tax=Stigmatella ashevillensis TaxID=2995309 RepID=A0ABT5DLX6_9BACT|nr:hypothetical protein [Stigmatella ashevillena]MDC0714670.1 hypothetical protein [Stigmatella ashevillena]
MRLNRRRGYFEGLAILGAWVFALTAGGAWAQETQEAQEAPSLQAVRIPGGQAWGGGNSGWEAALRDTPAFRFQEAARFTFLTTRNTGYPRVEGDRLVLIPENRANAAGAVFLNEPVRPPFAVQFQFSTFNRGGGGPWAVGDGVVLMFGRRAPARRESLPVGGTRGFNPDGVGFGVHLPLYGNERGVLLTDGSGRSLASRPNPAAYTGGEWATLRVEVERDGIRVFLNGEPQIDWRGQVQLSSDRLALSAATGAAGALHAVRDVRLTFQPRQAPPPPPHGPPPGPPSGPPQRGELLTNGGFEQPSLPRGNYRSMPSVPGWNRSVGRSIELQNRVAGSPASGDQYIELDGDDNTGIYQEVSTRPGAEYELRLAFSARPGTDVSDNALDVVWNGRVLTRLQASGQGLSETAWTYAIFRVRAEGPSSRVELRDVGASNGSGTYVDDVSLRQVTDSRR